MYIKWIKTAVLQVQLQFIFNITIYCSGDENIIFISLELKNQKKISGLESLSMNSE